MKETLFDSHCHLTHPRFEEDLDAVIERSRREGVNRFVLIGTDPDSSRRAIELASRHEGCYATVGISPHDAGKHSLEDVKELAWLAQHPKVVALGEIGLEYHYPFTPRDVQQVFFRSQIQLAHQLELPIIIHHREADADLRRIIEEEGLPKAGGVMHCFSGDARLLRWSLEIGFHISYSGIITFRNAKDIRECLSETPLDRLLIETDAPYLAPEPFRGRRCEPSLLPHTAKEAARLLGLQPDDIARITRRNALRLFRLPDHEPPQIAYAIGKNLYLNITNQCSNRCVFCIRFQERELKGHRLKLDHEPDLSEVLDAISRHRLTDYEEVVFCGYGEPTYRMNLLLETADFLKTQGCRVRLNTNGHGNLINHGDIVSDLPGRIDTVSISLNCHDPDQYQKICRSEFGTDGWYAMVQFIQRCQSVGLDTQVSIVEMPEIDIAACERLAQDLGVRLLRRGVDGSSSS